MRHLWKMQVRRSVSLPFKYHATFVWNEERGRDRESDFYAEGDLAYYLDECGAEHRDISALLETLKAEPDAEIVVRPTEEFLELLWPRAEA